MLTIDAAVASSSHHNIIREVLVLDLRSKGSWYLLYQLLLYWLR